MMFVIIFAFIAMIAGAGPTGSTHHAENYSQLPAFPNGFKVGSTSMQQPGHSNFFVLLDLGLLYHCSDPLYRRQTTWNFKHRSLAFRDCNG